MEIIKQFANASGGGNTNLISVLGIDWMTLIFQIGAFLVLVWLLGKFAYPWLLKSIDDRQANVEASAKAAADAQIATQDTEKRVSKLLIEARTEANHIVSSAKAESVEILNLAEEKSKKRSEQIIIEAQAQINKDVLAAKKALHDEMVDLVTMATEKVVGKVVSDDIDNKLIVETLKDIK